jgi:hypothetical protein
VPSSTSLPDAVPPTTGGFGTGATAVGLGGVGVGVAFTGPSVCAGLGLADALLDAVAVAVAVVAAAAAEVAAVEVVAAEVAAAELTGALLAAADPGAEAALDAAGLNAWLAGAELWCPEWLHAALRPASAAIMVAVTAVLGVRFMLHHRLGGSRSEAICRPISAE